MQKINLSPRTMRILDLAEAQHPSYDANEMKYGSGGCLLCAKPLKDEDAMPNDRGTFWLHLLTNGDLVEHGDDTDEREFGERLDQGWFQVGHQCYKRYVKDAKVVSVDEYLKNNK